MDTKIQTHQRKKKSTFKSNKTKDLCLRFNMRGDNAVYSCKLNDDVDV